MSGCMPADCNSFTLCCVGLVFSSPAAFRKGTYVRCTQTASLPNSHFNCLIASKNGALSMSPIVPPISVMIKSGAPDGALSSMVARCLMRCFISSVICGTTCIVCPR